MNQTTTPGVLFVCFGNICRSPSAHGILDKKLLEQGIRTRFKVDSCGTAAINLGKEPDARAQTSAFAFGYDISALRARQITDDDYRNFSHIIAMDRKNLLHINSWVPDGFIGNISMMMDHHPKLRRATEIKDPYYSNASEFNTMIPLLEECVDGLLQTLRDEYGV